MKMFNKKIKVRTIAYFLLIPSFLLFLGAIAAILIVPAFAFGSDVSIGAMIPFFFVSSMVFLLSFLCMLISIRYFKNKPFKRNHSLGTVMVIFSSIYLVYTVIICILSNLTGNLGGFGAPLIALLLLLIFLPLGLGLKNGYKRN